MRTAAVLLTAAVAAAPAWSQPPRTLVTNPAPPSREALDRLNLQLGWRALLPTDGLRDGLATVQFLGDLIVVQTRSGLLVALEAETGAPRWTVRIGHYPPVPLPVGSNSR